MPTNSASIFATASLSAWRAGRTSGYQRDGDLRVAHLLLHTGLTSARSAEPKTTRTDADAASSKRQGHRTGSALQRIFAILEKRAYPCGRHR